MSEPIVLTLSGGVIELLDAPAGTVIIVRDYDIDDPANYYPEQIICDESGRYVERGFQVPD